MFSTLIDWILHLDTHLAALASSRAVLVYVVLFAVIFIETGVVVLPFLPGDSLLFVAGAMAAQGTFSLPVLAPLLMLAAILGDSMNYAIGSRMRTSMVDKHRIRFIKPEYLERTHDFFDRHGRKTIVLARFVPVVRTFAPFVAALGHMAYGVFLAYNVVGGMLWVGALIGAGVAFGNLPRVAEHLTLVILGIVAVSLVPGLIGWVTGKKQGEASTSGSNFASAKVPEVTVLFWIIKIAATTLGETGGDAVSMSMNLGYLVGTGIFAAVFLAAVTAQIKARQFHPMLYWVTIIATTTVGTTLADFADRSLGIGYAGGSALLLALLLASLFVWHRSLGSVSVSTVSSPRAEAFYWVTIMFSQTLGTALGDWTADTAGLGYTGAAVVFGGLLALVVAAYYWTRVSRTVLFWAAFILTRPLGAVVGDFLDKPLNAGGLALSRYSASAALFAFILTSILLFRQRAARAAH